MKHAFLAVALILASSVAFADTTSVLLDLEKVRSMSAEEYAAAVRSAPDVNARDKKLTRIASDCRHPGVHPCTYSRPPRNPRNGP